MGKKRSTKARRLRRRKNTVSYAEMMGFATPRKPSKVGVAAGKLRALRTASGGQGGLTDAEKHQLQRLLGASGSSGGGAGKMSTQELAALQAAARGELYGKPKAKPKKGKGKKSSKKGKSKGKKSSKKRSSKKAPAKKSTKKRSTKKRSSKKRSARRPAVVAANPRRKTKKRARGRRGVGSRLESPRLWRGGVRSGAVIDYARHNPKKGKKKVGKKRKGGKRRKASGLAALLKLNNKPKRKGKKKSSGKKRSSKRRARKNPPTKKAGRRKGARRAARRSGLIRMRNPIGGILRDVKANYMKLASANRWVTAVQIGAGMGLAHTTTDYLARQASRYRIPVQNRGLGGVALSATATVVNATLAGVASQLAMRFLPRMPLVGRAIGGLGANMLIGGTVYTVARAAFEFVPQIARTLRLPNLGRPAPALPGPAPSAESMEGFAGYLPAHGMGAVESPEALVAGESQARAMTHMADWMELQGMSGSGGQPVPFEDLKGWVEFEPNSPYVMENQFDPASESF